MSSHLTVTQTTELLESLRGIVRDFAASEEKLNRDFSAKTAAARKRFQDDIAAHEAQLAERLDQADATFRAEKTRLQARDEKRRGRITKAHKSSQRQAAERIDDKEGRGKYQVQRGLLDTKRQRTEALAQNDATFASFNEQLAQECEVLASLERRAQKSFRGYRKFRQLAERADVLPDTDFSRDEYQLIEQLRQIEKRSAEGLAGFQTFFLPRVFRNLPLWLWIVLIIVCAGAAVKMPAQFGLRAVSYEQTGAGAGALLALVFGIYFFGRSKAAPLAVRIANELETARRLHTACAEKAQARHAQETERIETEAKNRTEMFEQNWRVALEEAAAEREVSPGKIDAKWRRVSEKHEQLAGARVERLERGHASSVERRKQEGDARRQQLVETHKATLDRFNTDHRARWEKLEADWKNAVQPIYETIRVANCAAEKDFPPWQPSLWANWTPPESFLNAAKFARIEVDVRRFADAAPQDPRLAFPREPLISIPLVLTHPQQGSILFETTKSGNEPVIAALNNIIFRLLATTPVGKLSFTIIDPVKLGQNFATVMHLADYEDNLINNRIWTQTNQIDERLADLNEHMEKVIQMYLRNEYETIAEYNQQAGNIAEKYHFVVVADFPANFTETAVRRLLRIAASGARCGVYTLIHWDHRHVAPPDFFPEELRKSSVCINATGEHFLLAHPLVSRANVLLDAPPDPDFATGFLHKVGEASRGSNRVEVPFTQVAPTEQEVWTLDTTDELRVPIGRSGATKLQYLSIGKGTRQHALIAGKTGSGKSTLFHVIITNLALWASPEQVEFYLVDFKKGVEFKAYATARLPHARVVAIESDREFGLSVLQRLDEELKRRGDLFRKLGVQDIAGYKRAGGTEPMPRCLLLIDEFQEFFVEDDRISQTANVLLDRIVRQGRAFGIHVLLGSQTLGGAYTLARTTIGQMVIRIALQCNEADAYLIMDENNAAPRLLTRPGEGIYNDMAGAAGGNSPFQAVWLSEDEREGYLNRVRALAAQKGRAFAEPIVFEGNAPADVRENSLLRALLGADSVQPTASPCIWFGAPNSIKGPTEAVFQKRSGSNLLIVGQREEAVLAILSVGLVALGAQFPRGSVRFVLFESTAPGSTERAFLERIVRAIPHEVVFAKSGDLSEIVTGLANDLNQRTEDEHAPVPTTFLFIHGMQNFKKLRQEEDFSFSMDDAGKSGNAAAQLQKLISEGPSHGIHVIASLDTYNNVNRFLGRKGLSEFEMRVLFQMSTNDSASLCDDPKASTLGLHRALFYNEQEGYLETFRPYALPSGEWIADAAKELSRLVKG